MSSRMDWKVECVFDEPSAVGEGYWVVVRFSGDEMSGPGEVEALLVFRTEHGWRVDLQGDLFRPTQRATNSSHN